MLGHRSSLISSGAMGGLLTEITHFRGRQNPLLWFRAHAAPRCFPLRSAVPQIRWRSRFFTLRMLLMFSFPQKHAHAGRPRRCNSPNLLLPSKPVEETLLGFDNQHAN